MKHPRAAYALTECLVVLTLIGATLTSIGLLMHALQRSERRLRDQLDHDRAVQQLARQLRWDAHRAMSVAIETIEAGGPDVVVLTLPPPEGRVVRYPLGRQSIDRVLKQDGQTIGFESYRLPLMQSARWQLEPGGKTLLIHLIIERRAGPAGLVEKAQPAEEIIAAVGLDVPQPSAPQEIPQ